MLIVLLAIIAAIVALDLLVGSLRVPEPKGEKTDVDRFFEAMKADQGGSSAPQW